MFGVSILQYKAPAVTIVVIWYNINKIEVRLYDHLEYFHWSNTVICKFGYLLWLLWFPVHTLSIH